MREERGATLIEFAFAMIIYAAFMYGLLATTMWAIGAAFVQETAHETAERYAVMLDQADAVERAQARLTKWAALFVRPETAVIKLSHDSSKAEAEITVEPRIKKLYLYNLPHYTKVSRCTLEDYFRHPENYSH